MKRKYVCKAICGLICFALASLALVNEARADGTEQLGPPSIAIAQGSQIVVAGTGLNDPLAQPGDITIEIPAGITVAQVLLYWTGRTEADLPQDTIQVNGMDVTGPRIGGPTPPPIPAPSQTYRADVTAEGWVVAGQVNVLSVEGLDFGFHNDGAAVVVILDDGSTTDMQILDGNDFASLLNGDMECVPVEFSFAPSADPQMGYIWLIVTDIDVPRPAAVDVTVGGVLQRLDVLDVNEGDYMQVVELEVPLPAGVSNVVVQPVSIHDDSGLDPSSLSWNFVSWELAEPEDEGGCTYTIGYWKTHPEDWPTNALSLYTGQEAMDILWTPPKGGNAYLILAHQYIGAELNAVNGASVPEDVNQAWLDAQVLLAYYQSEGNIPKKTDDRDEAIDLAYMLDDYNNGVIGPGHCDDNCDCN